MKVTPILKTWVKHWPKHTQDEVYLRILSAIEAEEKGCEPPANGSFTLEITNVNGKSTRKFWK